MIESGGHCRDMAECKKGAMASACKEYAAQDHRHACASSGSVTRVRMADDQGCVPSLTKWGGCVTCGRGNGFGGKVERIEDVEI